MWLMLQQDEPSDYVVASGRSTAVREMCRIAFEYVGLRADDHVVVSKDYLRPAEVDELRGDASKAKARLGWAPTVSLENMIHEMVDADLKRLRDQ
jgi:GDPmannose 4,6-dehydratase